MYDFFSIFKEKTFGRKSAAKTFGHLLGANFIPEGGGCYLGKNGCCVCVDGKSRFFHLPKSR